MAQAKPYDFYNHLYSNLFKIPINKITPEQRQECKLAVYNATYQRNAAIISMFKKEAKES